MMTTHDDVTIYVWMSLLQFSFGLMRTFLFLHVEMISQLSINDRHTQLVKVAQGSKK